VLLAPVLWMLGSQERWLARTMAERFVRTRDGYAQRPASFFDDGADVMPRGVAGGWGREGFSGGRPGVRVGNLADAVRGLPKMRIRQGRTGWVIEVEQ
jgi:hypothetical protein